LRSIAEVSAAAWNEVVGESAVPFLRWEWIHALEASGSATEETGWAPHHLTLWRGDRLVALAPAYLKTHSMGEYIYDFAWAEAARSLGIRYYPKLVVGVPLSPVTAPRFNVAPGESVSIAELEALALGAAQDAGCSSVHVLFSPAEEVEKASASWAHRLSMQYHWVNEGYRSYDEFLARFDAKRRNQLRRERGAAARQGISIRTVRGAGLDASHAALAYRFYAATCEKNPWGRLQLTADFFARVFHALPNVVELVVAERAGKVIAGAFNVATGQRLYGRYWGCFEDHPFLHFHVCLYHSIDECIQRGRQAFEPGAGGEHKISRGFAPTAIHSLHQLFSPKLNALVRAFLEREASHIAEVVDQGGEIVGFKTR
jgi:predicted N-acyltransferase